YAANPNAPYVTSISETLGHSLLYNVNRPYYAHLLRLLRTRSVIIPRIRISAAQSAFNTFLQRMNVTLVTVTSLRQEETNATILSAYFSPDQFQDNIIDIVFPTPIVIRPYQFILFDVPGTSGGDIANGAQTTFMNINFLGVRIVQGDFS
ncbi:MAG: hypothetical protein N2205_06420, partial [Candidatus Caldatribacterium sp.]|nr:hypothetical protein [Candidatus Caldatribacterium sp.]